MENKINKLLHSITTNFPEINFEIVHNSFSPTLKHFLLKDSLNEKGFGTDHQYLIAIEKAYSEFIERKTFLELHRSFKNFYNSNGFAAHTDLKKAKQSSINELIERDSFILCWHSKTAPYWLNYEEIKSFLHQENLEIINTHKKFSLNLKLGIIAKNDQVLTCIAKIDGKYKGKKFFYIDTKTGSNIKMTLNALVESITYFSHFISKGHLLTLTSKKIKLKNPIDHFYYYLVNSKNINWFDRGSTHVMDIPPLDINSYQIQPEAILGISNLRRFVVFSESNSMQNYYCGDYSIDHLNLNRFKQLFGSNFKPYPYPPPLS